MEDPESPGLQGEKGAAYGGEDLSAKAVGGSKGIWKPGSSGVGKGDLSASLPER